MIENGTLYRWNGGGWNWSAVASAHLSVGGGAHDWWIRRSDVDELRVDDASHLVFSAGGGGLPPYVSPVYVFRFSP